MSYFCADISEDTFNCFSDCAGYDYDVKVMDSADLEKAMDIAERELMYYGCPEESPDESYYFCSGYWEVVGDALIENGIAAKLIADRTEEE